MNKLQRLDALGDRLKQYERAETSAKFLPMIPLYARLDGRSFSKFTKGMQRPYDLDMSKAMQEVTKYLVDQTGALTGYTQSDEISLVWLNENPKGDVFFAGKKQKMVSSLAAMATAKFLQEAIKHWPEKDLLGKGKLPTFDARVFQLPNKTEAMNCFLWRVQDATKNSVSMAASEMFSHKQLLNKNSNDKKQMMLENGVVWEDYPEHFKNGSFVKRKSYLKWTNKGDDYFSTERTKVECIEFDKIIEWPPFYSMSTEARIEFVMTKVLIPEEVNAERVRNVYKTIGKPPKI